MTMLGAVSSTPISISSYVKDARCEKEGLQHGQAVKRA
jgi:hypothetical protein